MSHFTKNQWIVTGILSISLLVFAQCNQATGLPPQPKESSETKATEKVAAKTDSPADDDIIELQIAWWGSENRHEKTIEVIKLFEQQYPNIKIDYTFADWADYWPMMETLAEDGNLPDVMQQDYARLGEWVKKGWIVPLDTFTETGMLDFTNVSNAVLDTGQVDGQLYGVSLGTNSQAILIDVDAFEDAGLESPSPNWTWQEFEETAIQLHEKLNIWGIGDRLTSTPLLWQSYLLGHGQWSYTPNGTGLAYAETHIVDYLHMLLRLQQNQVIPHRTNAEDLLIEPETNVETRPIINKMAAMDYLWSNQIIAAWTAAGEERRFKMMPLPRPEGGQSSNYLKPSMFFSITPHSKHPKEAALFIDFFTNSLEANEIMLAERGVPISSVVREDLLLLLSPAQYEMFTFLEQIEYDNSPIPPPTPPEHGKIIDEIYYPTLINPALLEEITPEEAAANFRATTSKILSADDIDITSYTFGVVYNNLVYPWYQAEKAGIERQADLMGINLISMESLDDPATELANINKLIQQEVDLILLLGTDETTGGKSTQLANKADIPIIALSRATDNSGQVVTTIDTDTFLQAKTIATFMAEQLDGKGQVAQIQGVPGVSNVRLRDEGLRAALANYPDIELTASVYGYFNPNAAEEAMQDILTLHPEINAVYAHNDGMMVGIRNALKKAGKLDTVLTFAFDGEPVAIEAIEQGTQTATMGVVPAQEGAMGVIVGVMYLQGQTIPNHIHTPSMLVTKDSVVDFPGWDGKGTEPFFTHDGKSWNPSLAVD